MAQDGAARSAPSRRRPISRDAAGGGPLTLVYAGRTPYAAVCNLWFHWMESPLQGPGAERIVARAREVLGAGDKVSALALFEQALREDPEHLPALLGRARLLRELARLEEAEQALNAVLEVAPRHAEALIHLGLLARQRGDRAGARARFEAAVAAEPASLWARLELAAELRELGRLDEAEAAYQAVLAERPGHAGALLGLGLCARRRGDGEGALRYLAAGVEADPGSLWARVELGAALHQLGRRDEAEAAYREVLARQPGHAAALLGLGRLANDRGDRAEARARFEAAAAANPADIWSRLELARLLLATNAPAEAEAALREVLGLKPGDAQALHLLGVAARQRGDRAGARARFEAVVAADPANMWSRLELAAEYRDRGLLEEARRTIAPMLQEDPRYVQAWIRHGQIERAAGDHEAALRAFEKAHALSPEAAAALVEIAYEHRLLGDPAAAEAALRRALALQPDHLWGMMLLAEHAAQAERHEECLALCRRAMAAHPTTLWPHVAAAKALAEVEGLDAAFAFLDEVEARLGPALEIEAKRFELLRRMGRYDDMRALLDRAGAEAVRGHAWLWPEKVRMLIRLGEFAEAAAELEAAPAGTAREAAGVALLRGQLAEAQWQLDTALAHYREAARRDPENPVVHHEIARASLLRFELETTRRHLALWARLKATPRRLRGEALNPSQSHIGQILDECLLDAGIRARLAELSGLPPEERVAPLLGLVRANPDHTPAAVCLMVALRQAGLLPAGAPAEGGSRIPKRIMQFWTGSEVPDDLRQLMRSWGEANPDHAITLFDDGSALAFLSARAAPEVARAYRRARYPTTRADLFRLAWLFAEGGIYADADDRCLRPLSRILPAGAGFVAYQEDFDTLGNNFLAVAPGDAVIGRALALAAEAINRGDDDMVWLATGPGLVTRAFAQVLAEAPSLADGLRGRVVLDRSRLAAAVAIHCEAGYKNTARHWSRMLAGGRRAAAM